MCLTLYISSAKPLPLLPFDPEHPAFHVLELPSAAADVRAHFRHPHVYRVGSYQGCSCAFNYEHDFEPIRSLERYLKIALADGNELEGFACRTGHEEHEGKHSKVVSPEMLAMPRFYFHDCLYLQIVPSLKPSEPASAASDTNCAPGLMAESCMGARAGSTAS